MKSKVELTDKHGKTTEYTGDLAFAFCVDLEKDKYDGIVCENALVTSLDYVTMAKVVCEAVHRKVKNDPVSLDMLQVSVNKACGQETMPAQAKSTYIFKYSAFLHPRDKVAIRKEIKQQLAEGVLLLDGSAFYVGHEIDVCGHKIEVKFVDQSRMQ